MSNSYTYTAELEHLIVNTLLPVYEKYCKENDVKDAFKNIDPKLLQQIKRKKLLAALLRPKEI